jgi:plasmid stabilization system protein ParE
VKVIWSTQARDELRAINDFIGRDSEFYAARLVGRLIQRVKAAASRSFLGHRVHEYPELPLREIHEGSYRIIYRKTSRSLEVVAIIHFKQHLSRRRLG